MPGQSDAPGALDLLEKWSRKYYRFELKTGGYVQPGDGAWIVLSNGHRKVHVSDYELDKTNEVGDTVECTLAELIEEAIRQWHADTTLKHYRVSWYGDLGCTPTADVTVERVGSQHDGRWYGYWMATLIARTEDEAVDKVRQLFSEHERPAVGKFHVTEGRPFKE